MKITKALALIMAAAGLLAFAAPANAQSNRHGGGNSNRGDMHRNDGRHGDFRFHRGGNRVNFFFGGAFGYPFYGYPFYGYPYYGYAPYGYAPYGYGYPVGAYNAYDPRGIYQGQMVDSGGGSNKSVAVQVQRQLASGGYYHGEIDGIVGERTRRAIRNYERDNNLPVDGRIDDQLLATMGRG
jgi:hypothetical protein